MKNKLSLFLSGVFAALTVALLSTLAIPAYALEALETSPQPATNQQNADNQAANENAVSPGERKTRRVPALRSNVYTQLSRAQSAGDAGNVAEALEILDEVKSKRSSMNAYEQSMMYNFYGFIYYNSQQLDKAIESFEQAIAQQPIPAKYEQTTLFSLAQLHMAQGNYEKSIKMLEQWEALNNGVIPPKNFVLKAQAHYQNKNYAESARYIEMAIEGHEAEGYLPDEAWLILQRAVYYEMKQPEKVKEILAKMIRLYDNPQYWIQLAGMYGELGQEKKQLAMMESAYHMGYVQSASDIFNFAQLYYYHEAPYKAARLMEIAIKNGTLEANLRNLKFLSVCWTAAKEKSKAIDVLIDAAQLSDDGELDAQLGHLYYSSDDFDKAIESSTLAIQKGGLANQGAVHMVIGLSHYNQKRYVEALDELAKAEAFKASRAAAQQWGRFVSTEKNEAERLASAL
ncbi:tetratricopeptide repeat protein [Glaciecola sp. MH2013]|uniref:tetratricopeptide repeat protein n=1 Tax=Glaciecola sp. MH2013 TaxID=2785524 RepID=UPI0018A083A7|nr:tetratricopeptide repeat protein [Glaciecola sp. MH2013]MBF7071944.1 tetratricopeptide repeat protein [Glaciecola sp. MH2013]